MASLGHIAVGIAAARLASDGRSLTLRAAVAWSALSLLPDLDVLGFVLRVPYGAPFGHRGATHSLAFAMALGVLAALVAQRARLPPLRTSILVTLVVASHGLLDTMTDGGKGVAVLWPLSTERFFFWWRPIPVAPIGTRFISARGLGVAMTELVYFAPLLLWALWPRRREPHNAEQEHRGPNPGSTPGG